MKVRVGGQCFLGKIILAILVAVILGVNGTAGCAKLVSLHKVSILFDLHIGSCF